MYAGVQVFMEGFRAPAGFPLGGGLKVISIKTAQLVPVGVIEKERDRKVGLRRGARRIQPVSQSFARTGRLGLFEAGLHGLSGRSRP